MAGGQRIGADQRLPTVHDVYLNPQ